MLDGVWGEQPASCVDSHHSGSDGGTSDEPDWWHFMPSMFQYLPVHMHWEYLWLWAHTHQMYTHRGIGAHADIWKEKRKLWVSLWFLHCQYWQYWHDSQYFPLHRHTHPSIYHSIPSAMSLFLKIQLWPKVLAMAQRSFGTLCNLQLLND